MGNSKKNQVSVYKIIFLTLLLSPGQILMAYDTTTENSPAILETRPLNIDGGAENKRNQQKAELTQERQELQDFTNGMVQKNVEAMRLEEEKKITHRLQNLFAKGKDVGNNPGNDQDEQGKTNLSQKSLSSNSTKKNFKLSPLIGGGMVSTPHDNFENKYVTGLQFESYLNPRFALGLGFHYSSMEITEINKQAYNWYYQWYSQYFGNQTSNRQIENEQLGLDFYGKIYLSLETAIRPYLGLGLGYLRSDISYKDKENASYYRFAPQWNGGQNVQSGSEDYSMSTLSGLLKAGFDVPFSETVGLQVEAQYTKSITELSSTSEAFGSYYNEDQYLLEQLGSDIHKGHHYSLTAGLMVLF